VNQGQQSRWRSIRRYVLWTVGINVALVLASIIVLGYVREWEWTGLVLDQAYTKRTLWDWLQLLIIPAVLAGEGSGSTASNESKSCRPQIDARKMRSRMPLKRAIV
jgi:hypothetical protein